MAKYSGANMIFLTEARGCERLDRRCESSRITPNEKQTVKLGPAFEKTRVLL